MDLEKYKSNDVISIPISEVYTDRFGYLNEKAFYHYIEQKKGRFRIKNFFLVCLNIDLRKSNSRSVELGDEVLHEFIFSLADYNVFRIQGEKFNIIVEESKLDELINILERPSEDYEIYYGIVRDRFLGDPEEYVKELLKKGINLMYLCKKQKQEKKKTDVLDGKNIPNELKETVTKKYRKTMWHSLIQVEITEPSYSKFQVYVFPTEHKEPLQSIKSIIVIYDNVKYRCYYGENVKFGRDELIFHVNTRFDRDGHLNTTIYHVGEGNCLYKIDTKEGVCIPKNFGKRISPTKEIYPIRKNLQGYCDFVSLEQGEIELNTEGIINGSKGNKYGVVMDEKAIDLVMLED